MEEQLHSMDDIPSDSRLLPRVVDIRAENTPDRTYAYLPKSSRLEDGFYPLTYAAFAKAINAASWWMDEVFGHETGDDFPPIAYIGVNDLRYAILTYASIKTRRRFLIPLHHNTPEAQVRLLQQARCSHVLASKNRTQLWGPALAATETIRLIEVPELSHFINDAHVDHYPYTRTFEEAKDDPTWTIQTSGTTGNPRPLDYNNRTSMLSLDNSGDRENVTAIQHLIRDCHYINLLPLSWGVGLTTVMAWPLLFGTVTIVLPDSVPQPMTPEYTAEVIDRAPKGKKNGIVFIPEVLRRFAKVPSCIAKLKQFDWVGYAGAPLDTPSGDEISKVTRVQSCMGATDVGLYPLLLDDPADWNIHRFHPTWLGFYFEHFQDDLYELCVRRQDDDCRPAFTADPTLEVYHTKDLWQKAPGREDEGFWTTAGRIDDFVKLASMTKFNAIQIEQVLDRHPLIERTLVGGDGMTRPFALVQLKDPAIVLRDVVMDEIWPAFNEANQTIVKEARLTRALILFTDPDMPLKQTAKATIDRRNTIAMYESRLEALYDAAAHAQEQHGA